MINELKKTNERYSISLEDIQQYLDEIYKQCDVVIYSGESWPENSEMKKVVAEWMKEAGHGEDVALFGTMLTQVFPQLVCHEIAKRAINGKF